MLPYAKKFTSLRSLRAGLATLPLGSPVPFPGMPLPIDSKVATQQVCVQRNVAVTCLLHADLVEAF